MNSTDAFVFGSLVTFIVMMFNSKTIYEFYLDVKSEYNLLTGKTEEEEGSILSYTT